MLRRGWLVLLVLAAVVVATSSASAQTIGAITPNIVTRSHITRSTSINAISRKDCAEGDAFTFPLTISYTSGWSLEVWVSQNRDCTDNGARGLNNGLAPTCGLVYRSSSPQAPTTSIEISDKAILSAIRAPSANIDPNPTCDTPPNAGVGLQSVTVFFMFVKDGGTNVQGTQKVDFIQYATKGAAPPAAITAGVASNALKVSWTQNTDSTVMGYYVFCDPMPGQELGLGIQTGMTASSDTVGVTRWAQVYNGEDAGDAATTEPQASADAAVSDAAADAGDDADASSSDGVVSDASNAASQQCGTTVLSNKEAAADLYKTNLCATVYGYATTNALVEHLNNGYSYKVAVASFDTLGNLGDLSDPYCDPAQTTPRPVVGFYEKYKESGGTALDNSGLCSIRSVGMNAKRASWAGGVMLAMATGLALLRRSKRRH